MRPVFLFLFVPVIFGCPAVDPVRKSIAVQNLSDSVIYVSYSCSDTLQLLPKLVLFEDQYYNGGNHHVSPSYRVNAHEFGSIGVSGRETLLNACPGHRLWVFFISEEVLKTYEWEEICSKQLYNKKVVFDMENLRNINWVITYH